MASVYKRKADKRNKSRPYYIAYTDENGRRRTVKGCLDRAATEEIARKLETEVELRKRGVIDPSAERFAKHGSVPLREHIEEYLADCGHVGQSKTHLKIKRARLKRLVSGIGAARLSDLEPNAVARYLRSARDANMSARSINAQRAAVVAFLNWCVRTGRVQTNPLSVIPKLDERRDRRRLRRPLKEDEIARLLVVAGPRRTFYLVAAWTGLRRGELGRITWGDVDFETKTLRVRVGVGKVPREDIISLHSQAVEALAEAKPSAPKVSDRVFPALPTNRTRVRDFERARIELVDSDGRHADLHALARMTLGTTCVREGLSPEYTSRILRHADYRTTRQYYIGLQVSDIAAVVDSLPRIGRTPGTAWEQVAATGTEGRQASPARRAAPQQRAERTNVQLRAAQGTDRDQTQRSADACKWQPEHQLASRFTAVQEHPRRGSNPQPLAPEANALSS